MNGHLRKTLGCTSRAEREKDNPNYLLAVLYGVRERVKMFPRERALHDMVWSKGFGY